MFNNFSTLLQIIRHKPRKSLCEIYYTMSNGDIICAYNLIIIVKYYLMNIQGSSLIKKNHPALTMH